jgi:hypothetical protein
MSRGKKICLLIFGTVLFAIAARLFFFRAQVSRLAARPRPRISELSS